MEYSRSIYEGPLSKSDRTQITYNNNTQTSIMHLHLTEPDNWHKWATQNACEFRDAMTYGAVVLNGAQFSLPLHLTELATAVGGSLLDYNERSTPRTRVAGQIYTSTEYPAHQIIPLHNENSYKDSWPHYVFFLCTLAAAEGGETTVADARAVLRLLPPAIVDKFRRLGVLYTRTFREGLGLPWQEVFQAKDQPQVEEYCRAHDIEFEWEKDILRTRQRRPSTTLHRVTGEEVWFNQAHLFHVGALPTDVRESLLEIYQPSDLPRNAYYGNGDPITQGELDAIFCAYAEAEIAHQWVAGDVLMIDNIIMSHGRRAFRGRRTVVVGMTKRG